MKLTWYGHSCFKIETSQGSAVLDPYSPGSVPGLGLPPLTADLVLCSHSHRDHGYADAVTLTGRAPSFAVTRLPSFHDGQQGALRGSNTVTLMEADGIRLVHMGDIGHIPDDDMIKSLGRVDILLVPVGGFYTIDAAAAHETALRLDARIVIPMHYSGRGFGYNEIGPAEDFLRLRQDVIRVKGSVIHTETLPERCTAVPECPVMR